MKTQKLYLQLFAGLMLTLFLAACGDNDNGNNAVALNQYQWNGSQCVQVQTGQVVNNQSCFNNCNTNQYGNQQYNQYGQYGQYGYNQYNYGNINQNCINGVNNGFNNGWGQVCVGSFFTTNGIPVNCNGSNCRNVTLYDQYGQIRYCQ